MSERYAKQVIVIRKDLNMRRGKEIAQGSHASMKFMAEQLHDGNDTVKLTTEARAWIDGQFTKVCLKVESEKELLEVFQAALSAGLTAKIIVDAGKTDAGSGKGNPTKTCIAIGPNWADEIDKVTGPKGSHSCKLY